MEIAYFIVFCSEAQRVAYVAYIKNEDDTLVIKRFLQLDLKAVYGAYMKCWFKIWIWIYTYITGRFFSRKNKK